MNEQQLREFISSLSPDQRGQLLRDVVRAKMRLDADQRRAEYRSPDGIVRFVVDVLKARPAPYQKRILSRFVEYHRVAVRGPHGLGKTALAAWVTLWGLLAFDDDVKVVTTASAWRQLELYLWPEIRKWSRAVRAQQPDLRLLTLKAQLFGKEAFAVASDNPALIEGAHAQTLIYVFDEAKVIPADTWDAAEGAFSGGGADTGQDAYALAISTPGAPTGRFYDICTHKPGLQDWHTEHVTLKEAIEAGRISREWADQRRQQWGEQSSVYQNRVEGNFATQDEDSVIPLAWVEAANERWYAVNGRGPADTEPAYGVDPARYGNDKTCTARMVGRVLEKLDYHAQQDTMQTAGRIAAQVRKTTPVGVDVIGIGAGVVDRLKELQYHVTGVNVASAALNWQGQPETDRTGTFQFVNLRSYLWWMLRDNLNPDNPDALALPADDILTGDLTAPKYTYTSKGLIKVESKDELRARLGRSTDAADALALAEYVNPRRPGVYVGPLWKAFIYEA